MDNLLLEMEMSLENHHNNTMAILPVMVGRMSDSDPSQYQRFTGFRSDGYPDVRSPSQRRGTVRGTIDKLFKLNALKLMSPLPTESDVDEIANVLHRIAWSSEKGSLNVRYSSIVWLVSAFFLFLFGYGDGFGAHY